MIGAPLCRILKIRLRKDYHFRNKNGGVGFMSNVRRKKNTNRLCFNPFHSTPNR